MAKRGFFHLPQSDRKAMILLIVLLLFVVSLYFFFFRKEATPLSVNEKDKAELEGFASSVRTQEEKYRREHFGKPWTSYKVETFPFDPNTADSITFLRLGLRPWMAHNALKYRAKGGHWRSADDFARLYGLSKSDFVRLRPYIRIHPSFAKPASAYRKDSVRRRANYPAKFKSLVHLDLNMVDTATLQKIPGIGSFYSRKIKEYGERLGGYVSVSQLKEIEGLPQGIERWFVMNTHSCRPLEINRATFKQLMRHPYLNYDQVKAIFDVRRKTGDIKTFQRLSLYPCFAPRDFERLRPYVKF